MNSIDSPDRLLQRVQQMEDLELPSLPSFQHDEEEFESTTIQSNAESSIDQSEGPSRVTQKFVATPHPLRKSFRPPSASPYTSDRSSETSTGSPYPPLLDRYGTPSPYAPTTARTSTPQTESQHIRSSVSQLPSTAQRAHRRNGSGNTELVDSTSTRQNRWKTPTELSRSFSGDEIPFGGSHHGDISEDKSDELGNDSILDHIPNHASEQTPMTHRLSSGNVVITRPGKRSVSGTFQPLQPVQEVQIPSPIASISEQTSPSVAPSTPSPRLLDGQNRIPSLSHSEVSNSERSDTASTPEGPSRNAQIVTPREGRSGSVIPLSTKRIDWSQIAETEQSGVSDAESEDLELAMPSLGSLLVNDPSSPAKGESTLGLSTPGVHRLDARNTTLGDQNTPRAREPLSDLASFQDTPRHIPFTPTPLSSGKANEFATARPFLNDADRRKSHVLAVLGSTMQPARVTRIPRGTPHPLRRVSLPPSTPSMSIQSPVSQPEWTASKSGDCLSSSPHHDGGAVDESFVSIASSADLTSDRRATSYKQGLSRGNTSFPTILLPTNNTASSPSLLHRAAHGDQRADGVKIHKHLNAMNKQLLETNADLAREAESWRQQVEHLSAQLQNLGVEPDLAIVNFDSSDQHLKVSQRHSLPAEGDMSTESSFASANGYRPGEAGIAVDQSGQIDRLTPVEQESLLREMAERLEELEAGLNEKNQLIAELERKLDARPDLESSQRSSMEKEVEALRRLVDDGQVERDAMRADFALRTEEHAKEFGTICAEYDAQIDVLEAELANVKEIIANSEAKQAAQDPIDGEKDNIDSDDKGSPSLQRRLDELLLENEELSAEMDILRSKEAKATPATSSPVQTPQSAMDTQQQVIELEESLKLASIDLQDLRATVLRLEGDVDARDEKIGTLMEDLERLQVGAKEDHDEQKRIIAILETEIARLKSEMTQISDNLAHKEAELEITRNTISKEVIETGRVQTETMEEHLEEAFKEIGRLKQLLSATPHLETVIHTRDAQIDILEREKAALQERLTAGRSTSGVQMAASPFKATPFVHKAIASLRMPKTPGSPMELSWLQNTVSEANEPILRAQIEHLQGELDDANDQLDSNFSRLEAAGMSGLHLAEKLAEAQQKISELEDEIRALVRRNQESLNLRDEQNDQERRDHDTRLDEALNAVHRQLEDVQHDFEHEKARLQRENKRLTLMVSELRSDHAMDLQAVRSECDKELSEKDDELRFRSGELKDARRALASSKEELDSTVRRVQMAEEALQDLKTTAASRIDVAELDSERRLVAKLREDLQSAREEICGLTETVGQREKGVRMAQDKVEQLTRERTTFIDQLAEFERDLGLQQKESLQFGIELRNLKQDQIKGSDEHKTQLAGARREVAIAQSKFRAAEQDLEKVERENRRLMQEVVLLREADSSAQVEDQRAKFRLQAQDLATQIRYLKAKFTREASFRNSLSLQKRYLLLLLGGMSLSEQATLKQIASMGFPVPAPPRPKRTFKAVGLAVISVIRARNMAADWKSAKEVKLNAVAARDQRKRMNA